MSYFYQWDSLHRVTQETIMNKADSAHVHILCEGDIEKVCGCHARRSGEWWLCTYHAGFQDGIDAVLVELTNG